MKNETEREIYNKELYSTDFTVQLLEQLYDFLKSEKVSSLNLFSNYDKASILNAIEHLENYEKLKNYVYGNEFDMYREFQEKFPNGL